MEFKTVALSGYDDSVVGGLVAQLSPEEQDTLLNAEDPVVTLTRLVFQAVGVKGAHVPENPHNSIYISPYTFREYSVSAILPGDMTKCAAGGAVRQGVDDGLAYRKWMERAGKLAAKYQEGDAE